MYQRPQIWEDRGQSLTRDKMVFSTFFILAVSFPFFIIFSFKRILILVTAEKGIGLVVGDSINSHIIFLLKISRFYSLSKSQTQNAARTES